MEYPFPSPTVTAAVPATHGIFPQGSAIIDYPLLPDSAMPVSAIIVPLLTDR